MACLKMIAPMETAFSITRMAMSMTELGSVTCKLPLSLVEHVSEYDFRRDGTGTFTSSKDGMRYIGQWKQNRRHGEGRLYMSSGDCLTATWDHGTLIQPTKFDFHKDSIWNNPEY